jgi:hypothetical protein
MKRSWRTAAVICRRWQRRYRKRGFGKRLN